MASSSSAGAARHYHLGCNRRRGYADEDGDDDNHVAEQVEMIFDDDEGGGDEHDESAYTGEEALAATGGGGPAAAAAIVVAAGAEVGEVDCISNDIRCIQRRAEIWKKFSAKKKTSSVWAFYRPSGLVEDERIDKNEGFTKRINDAGEELDDEVEQSSKFDFYSCTIVLECAVCLDNDGNKVKRTWKKSSGTNAMLLHVKKAHNLLWDKWNKYVANRDAGQPEAKKRRTNQSSSLSSSRKSIIELIRGGIRQTYRKEHPKQLEFEENLCLLVGKALLPLHFVDQPWMIRSYMCLDPMIEIPGRKRFVHTILNDCCRSIRVKHVEPKISSALCSVLSFDLWMSTGNYDIFSVMAHVIDVEGHHCSIFTAMLKMDNTSGPDIAEKLGAVIESFGLKSRVLGFVYDGGSNLEACAQFLSNDPFVNSEYFGTGTVFKGSCWAHILSTTIKKALSSSNEHDKGLSKVNSKAMFDVLQKCITWTKKSGLGARTWEMSCRATNLPHRKLYTPVKTRFGSKVMMLERVLEYKAAVIHCYATNENETLHSRLPSARVWKQAAAVYDLLKPILAICVQAQSGEDQWLLGDALVRCCDLYNSLQTAADAHSDVDAETDGEDEDKQRCVWLRSMAIASATYLRQQLKFMFEYIPEYEFNVYAIMLHPVHRDGIVFKNLVGFNFDDGVLEGYAMRLVDQLAIVYCRQNNLPLDAADGDGADAENAENVSLFQNVFNQQQPAQQSVKDKAQQELRNYLAEPFDESFGGQPIKWICSLAAKYPVVVEFARAVFTIPASQMSNERVFSVAGVCSQARRNRVGVENLEKIMTIYYNYPDDCTYGLHNRKVESRLAAVDAATMQREVSELIDRDISVEGEVELLFQEANDDE